MRRVWIGLGILGGTLAVLVVAAIVWRIELAGAVLRSVLARSGFEDASFAIERVDLGAIHVSGVVAGERLRADRVEVTLDLRRLPAAPVERVRVVGAQIDFEAPAATSAVEAPEEDRNLPPLGLLPVLELEQAIARVPSPLGTLVLRLDSSVIPQGAAIETTFRGELESPAARASFRGAARLDDAGAVSIHMNVASLAASDPRLRIESGSADLVLHGQANGLDLQAAAGSLSLALAGVVAGERRIGALAGKAPFELERGVRGWVVKLTDAHVRAPDEKLELASITGVVSAAGTELEIGRVAELGTTRRFAPLSIRLRADLPQISGDVETANRRASMKFQGTYDAAGGKARGTLTWPRVELDPARLKPGDLSPLLAFDGTITGALEGRADVEWEKAGGLSGSASLTLDGVTVAVGGVRADRLDGKIELATLLPPTTKGMQGLRLRELNAGVPLTDAVLLFRLERAEGGRGSRLRIDRLLTGFAGGRIVVEGAVLDPTTPANRLEFRFEDVDVAKLFEIAAIEGVAGSGRLSGSIPVTVEGGRVAIAEGKLVAGSGVLQVRSESAANLLAGGGRSAALLLEALRDFHYEELSVSIEKSFEGDATIRMTLAGNNPAVLEGRAFRVNVNLTGNLDRLVGALLEVARLSDKAVRATVEAAR